VRSHCAHLPPVDRHLSPQPTIASIDTAVAAISHPPRPPRPPARQPASPPARHPPVSRRIALSQRPATFDLRPATCDLRPATCDQRPATCEWLLAWPVVNGQAKNRERGDTPSNAWGNLHVHCTQYSLRTFSTTRDAHNTLHAAISTSLDCRQQQQPHNNNNHTPHTTHHTPHTTHHTPHTTHHTPHTTHHTLIDRERGW